MPAEAPPAQDAEQQIDGIRILPGTTNVLIVAPHGPYPVNPKTGKQEYKNDERTGLIAEAIQVETGWRTIINDAFVKPDKKKKEKPDFKDKRLDLFKIEQAKQVPGYLEAIKSAVDAHEGKTLVVWIHGMADGSATTQKRTHIKAGKMKKDDGELNALIGYGQGAHPRINKLKRLKTDKPEDGKDRLTAKKETVMRFRDELTAKGLFTLIARKEAPNFRGRDPERLNQWFLDDYTFDQVESIQIEIREKGFRETPEQCAETAKKLVEALRKIAPPAPLEVLEPETLDIPEAEGGDNLPVPKGQIEAMPEPLVPEIVDEPSEDELVEQTYAWLQSRLKEHIIDFTVEAGQYIIKIFYDGDPRRALAKNKTKDQPPSLKRLIQKIKDASASPSESAPSVSWFYKAVNLAAQDAIAREMGLSAFTILGHSHKLLLLNVPKLKQIEGDKFDDAIEPAFKVKERLAQIAVDENLSVRQLGRRIKEIAPQSSANITVDNVPEDAVLKELPKKKLDGLRAGLEKRIADIEDKLAQYKADKARVDQVLQQQENQPKRNFKAGSGQIASVFPMAKAVSYKWPRVEIKKDDGTLTQSTAPIIISASRRTDIPAHYAPWFMERLRRGYLATRYRNLRYISFRKARLIVFWTKNAAPMLPYLNEIDLMGLGYYFQFTLNDYEGDGLEPHLPPPSERIETFKELSDKIGKERVVWRFDPLALTDDITPEILVNKVSGVMERLTGHTEKMVISFLKASSHKKVVRNLEAANIDAMEFTNDDKIYVAKRLGELGKEYHIEVATCAEEMDLTQYGIIRNKCIDDGLIRRAFHKDEALMDFIGDGTMKDKGQRPLCGCLPSVDVGTPNTCAYLCPYCYENVSEKAVQKNRERATESGELLLE